MNRRYIHRRIGAALLATLPIVHTSTASAYTLTSTTESFLGTGEFQGPGVNTDNGPLFATVIHNMMFVNQLDFVTPYVNNGAAEPNICVETASTARADGKLADGSLINENVDTCPAVIAGVKVYPAVIAGGIHQGQQMSVTLPDGNVTMTMDFALDLGLGAQSVVKIPFYGTTGELIVPKSLQTQAGGKGVDQAGKYPSDTKLRGRVGDFNHDGWIDGTIVAAGVMPLSSRFYPGQPYVIIRHFETDIPIDGALSSNIEQLSKQTMNRTEPRHVAEARFGAALLSAVTLARGAPKSRASVQMHEIQIDKRHLYGPGPFPDQELAAGAVRSMQFDTFMNATVPAFNNGGKEPNVSGEAAQKSLVDGKMSDGTLINEHIEMGNAVIANGQFNLVLGAVYGGPNKGDSHFFLDPDFNWTIRDDIAMDPGFAEGMVKLNEFTFSTGPRRVPRSIQTEKGYPGGVDRVGTLKSGDLVIGRLGDDDFDGKVDGAFFAMGQFPITAAFLPGAPFVQRMQFTSDIPVTALQAAFLSVAGARNCLRTLEDQSRSASDRSVLLECARERVALAQRQLGQAKNGSGACEADCEAAARQLQALGTSETIGTDQLPALDALVTRLATQFKVKTRTL